MRLFSTACDSTELLLSAPLNAAVTVTLSSSAPRERTMLTVAVSAVSSTMPSRTYFLKPCIAAVMR